MTTDAERGAIDRVERGLDNLVKLVQDVRERLANMEGKAVHSIVDGLKHDLEEAKIRISTLEAEAHIRQGQIDASATWAEWTHRLAPWFFAVGLVVWNYIKFPR